MFVPASWAFRLPEFIRKIALQVITCINKISISWALKFANRKITIPATYSRTPCQRPQPIFLLKRERPAKNEWFSTKLQSRPQTTPLLLREARGVSSPDHTLYASFERGSGVIRRFSRACRATPPTWNTWLIFIVTWEDHCFVYSKL